MMLVRRIILGVQGSPWYSGVISGIYAAEVAEASKRQPKVRNC